MTRYFGIDRDDGSIAETSEGEQQSILEEFGRIEYDEISAFPDNVTAEELMEFFGVEDFQIYQHI